jgi:hypothetical protein
MKENGSELSGEIAFPVDSCLKCVVTVLLTVVSKKLSY